MSVSEVKVVFTYFLLPAYQRNVDRDWINVLGIQIVENLQSAGGEIMSLANISLVVSAG